MSSREHFVTANPLGSAESAGATRLCIVSRNPLVSGVFVAGLTASVDVRAKLEIVMDRRRGDAPAHAIPIERRHRDHVDRALEREGFAIVPTGTPNRTNGSRRGNNPWPAERGAAAEADERKIELILWLRQRRITRLRRWLMLSTLLNALLILGFAAPAVKALVTRARPAPSAPSVAAPGDRADDGAPRPLR